MLSLGTTQRGLGRREFLKVGGLALGGLSFLDAVAAQARAAAGTSVTTGKSVVFLFMHGGPSQIETFDPKMEAPPNVRSATGELPTAVPGVTFGGTFPRLARLARDVSIVRSFATGDGNHDIKPIVCRDTAGANLGSIYARVAGTNRASDGMPTNVALFPRSVDPSTQPATTSFGRFDAAGPLGSAYAPVVPGGNGHFQQDIRLAIAPDRLDDRRSLLAQLDAARWAAQQAGTLGGVDRLRQQAFDVLLGGVARAFDLSQERAATVERYDTAPLVRPENISRKWNNYNNYVDNAKSLGKLMLLARRLCQAGCGFVTVTTNFVWDMHSDVNNAGVHEGMQYMGLPMDHAVSEFLEDLKQQGLSDDILLVCCGEMGRTPRINAKGGRDHWGRLAPLLLAGGGLKMGHVVGQSSRDASRPDTEPVTIRHLIATILHVMFDVSQLRLVRGLPAPIAQMATWEPIRDLLP